MENITKLRLLCAVCLILLLAVGISEKREAQSTDAALETQAEQSEIQSGQSISQQEQIPETAENPNAEESDLTEEATEQIPEAEDYTEYLEPERDETADIEWTQPQL